MGESDSQELSHEQLEEGVRRRLRKHLGVVHGASHFLIRKPQVLPCGGYIGLIQFYIVCCFLRLGLDVK